MNGLRLVETRHDVEVPLPEVCCTVSPVERRGVTSSTSAGYGRAASALTKVRQAARMRAMTFLRAIATGGKTGW